MHRDGHHFFTSRRDDDTFLFLSIATAYSISVCVREVVASSDFNHGALFQVLALSHGFGGELLNLFKYFTKK